MQAETVLGMTAVGIVIEAKADNGPAGEQFLSCFLQ
jgi:hypothetical protein